VDLEDELVLTVPRCLVVSVCGIVYQPHISSWEKGKREPDLLSLLAYARAAGICVEVLIDDKLELPLELPPKKTYHPHK